MQLSELQSREMWLCLVLRFRLYLWNISSYFSKGHGVTTQRTTFLILPVCCKIQYKVNLSNTTVEIPRRFSHFLSVSTPIICQVQFVNATSRVSVIPSLCNIPSSVTWYILHCTLSLSHALVRTFPFMFYSVWFSLLSISGRFTWEHFFAAHYLHSFPVLLYSARCFCLFSPVKIPSLQTTAF